MNSRKTCVAARRVVITGIGVMAPNAIGATAYGAALRAGQSGVAAISLFDAAGLDCRIAAEVKNFRGEDFMSAQELRRVGRSVPLLIGAADQALAQAGVCWRTQSLADKQAWGVIIGSGGGTPDFTEEQYRWFFSERLRRVSAYNVSSSTPGALASELSLHFDLRGQSHLLSTGCTSSTDALGYAFNLIRFGVAERLLSGGADATITPGIMQGFCVMRVVSGSHNREPERASRPFDRRRDGFVLGEGAWALVLEERAAAQARGARIYGEILGYGSTCDAYHRVRLNPNGEEPARAMELAIQDAGVAKDEIGYVALHGTSTALNDKTETLAAKLCFGRRAYDIPMSSVKSMIGHPQGASGAAGLVAALLGTNQGFLPPPINYSDPDPECDLNYIPNRAIERAVDIALCNCIGFGSKNSALVIGRGEV